MMSILRVLYISQSNTKIDLCSYQQKQQNTECIKIHDTYKPVRLNVNESKFMKSIDF